MNFLIFGGRSPIAIALCQQLSIAGNQVHLVTRSRDEEIIKIATDSGVSEVHECDIQNSASAISFVLKIDEQVGGLQGLAFLHRYRSDNPKPLEQYEIEVYVPFQILEALSKQERQIELSVVLTSSPAAETVVIDQDFQYHASKAATTQLVRFGSVNFAKSHMRINGINPGFFVFKERAAQHYKKNPAIIESANKSVPLGRMSTVDEIASVATFLLSSSSSYINGQIINIDGGISNLAL